MTHRIADLVGDTFDVFRQKSGEAAEVTIDAATDAYRVVSESAEKAADGIRKRLKKANPQLPKEEVPVRKESTD